MGQSSSQPDSDTESLQYNDNIVFVYRQEIMLYDATNICLKERYQIDVEFKNDNIRISSVGVGVLVVTDSDKYIGIRCYSFLDKDLIHLKRQWAIFDSNKIDDFVIQKGKEIQTLNLAYEPGDWVDEENQLLNREHMKRLFPKNYIASSEAIKMEGNTIIADGYYFNYNPSWYYDGRIVATTYCRYDNILIVCVRNQLETRYTVEKWERLIDLNCSGPLWSLKLFIDIEKTDNITDITRVMSSKKNVFIQTNKTIIILDKDTLMQRHQMYGSHLIYQDHYGLWLDKSMNLMKSVNAMKEMSGDVLKIILLYID